MAVAKLVLCGTGKADETTIFTPIRHDCSLVDLCRFGRRANNAIY